MLHDHDKKQPLRLKQKSKIQFSFFEVVAEHPYACAWSSCFLGHRSVKCVSPVESLRGHCVWPLSYVF